MKTYTENEVIGLLNNLVEVIDKRFDLDMWISQNLILEEIEEEEIPFSYSFLRRKLDWGEFCDLTGIDLYARRNGYEIKDSEMFRIKESKAKKYSLL